MNSDDSGKGVSFKNLFKDSKIILKKFVRPIPSEYQNFELQTKTALAISSTLNKLLASDESESKSKIDVLLASVSKNEILATEQIHMKMKTADRRRLDDLCHRSKNLYNDAYFFIRGLYFLPNYQRLKSHSHAHFGESLEKLRNMLIPLNIITDTSVGKEILSRLASIKNKIDFITNANSFKTVPSLQYELFYLFKYFKTYQNLEYTPLAQEILKCVNDGWTSYCGLLKNWREEMKKYKNGTRKTLPKRPNLPHYLPRDSTYIIRYNRQSSVEKKWFLNHLKSTTRIQIYKKYISVSAEFRFPDAHSYFIKPIRIRLMPWLDKRSPELYNLYKKLGERGLIDYAVREFCARFRTITIAPRGDSYVAYISYVKKKKKLPTLDKTRCIAVDFGFNHLLTAVNNFGVRPLLYDGAEIKRANHLFLKKRDTYRHRITLLKYILDQHFRKSKSILDVINFRIKKFADDLHSHTHIRKLRNIIEDLTKREKEIEVLMKTDQSNLKNLHRQLKICRHDLHYYRHCLTYNQRIISRKIEFLTSLREKLLKLSLENYITELQQLHQLFEKTYYRALIHRNNVMRDQKNKIAHNIVEFARLNKCGYILFGYKKGWKKCHLARRFNAHWHLLPIAEILDTVKYKASFYGITIDWVSEHYSSQSSSLDRDPVKKLEKGQSFSGIRSPPMKGLRQPNGKWQIYYAYGLYYSLKKRQYIHSDVNGAFSIMRRYDQRNKTHFFDRVRDKYLRLSPIRLNLKTNNNYRLTSIASV